MNIATLLEQAAELKAAGFTTAATELERKAERARKLAIAYEHFRYISEEQVAEFNKKLKAKTSRPATAAEQEKFYRAGSRVSAVQDQLKFQALENYPGVPPMDVIGKVKDAKGRQCFDSFEVAEIVPEATHVKLPDPMVFGRVEGCTDRFYVAEWGSDVSINDLIQANQG